MGDLIVLDEQTQVSAEHNIGGRPSLYTEDIAATICKYLRKGDSIVAACGMAGIDPRVYYLWREEDREGFLQRSTRARAQGERMYSQIMRKAAAGDPDYKGDWRPAESVLKRQFFTSGWGDRFDVRTLSDDTIQRMLQAAQADSQAVTEHGSPARISGAEDI